MQIDLEKVPSGSTFESDICVIGAGVAGLLLSNKLARHGFRVHLLEAGGLHLEQRSQDLYKSEMQGVFYQGATEGRFRTFGGASTRWGGQLLAYPDEVFEKREALGSIVWPIVESDIRPYYPEIFKIMGVNDLPFTDEFLERFGHRAELKSEQVRVRFSKFAPFSKRNLGRTIGRKCLASHRITVFSHANAVSVDLDDEGSHVGSITVKNYQGGTYRFKARDYVICTGTIETSRLLLGSTGRQACGVGNLTDQVGRYFHDHLKVRAATLGKKSRAAFVKYFSPYYVRNTLLSPKLEATASWQRDEQLLGTMGHFFIHEGDTEFGLLRQMLVDLQRRQFAIKSLGRMPLLLSGAVKMAYALKVKGRRTISSQGGVTLDLETEQKPRFDSRIRISGRIDSIGLPETIVDWKVSNEEGESVRRFAGVIDRYLKSLGMTEIYWNPEFAEGAEVWTRACTDNLHAMGGARMGTSPESSVVDANLKVHGLANLYIAGCSVFPSGGSSNPTFTMMALACRLGDYLYRNAGNVAISAK